VLPKLYIKDVLIIFLHYLHTKDHFFSSGKWNRSQAKSCRTRNDQSVYQLTSVTCLYKPQSKFNLLYQLLLVSIAGMVVLLLELQSIQCLSNFFHRWPECGICFNTSNSKYSYFWSLFGPIFTLQSGIHYMSQPWSIWKKR